MITSGSNYQRMITDKIPKFFVILGVVSFFGLLVLQQSLSFYRIPKFFLDQNKEPSRVSNHFIIDNNQWQDKSSFNSEVRAGRNVSHSVPETRRSAAERISSATSVGKPIASNSIQKQTSVSFAIRSSDKSNPGTQTMSPTLDKRQTSPTLDKRQTTSPTLDKRQTMSPSLDKRQRTSSSLDKRQRTSLSLDKRQTTSPSLDKRQRTSSSLDKRQRTSPTLEKRPRLPKALIIGFSKCGTAALRTFLTIHPDVVSPILELRYFTMNFSKGPEWYRKQMPPSTEDQLTIEKTPMYIKTNESLQRIKDFNSKMKLVVIVRDPIVRLQSQYAHHFCHTEPSQRLPFKQWWNTKPNDIRIIRSSHFARYIRQVYSLFPRKQVLVLSEDDMERDPLSVLKEAEKFLELRPAYSKDMFVFNKTKGFYCFNVHSSWFPRVLPLVQVNKFTGCLGRDKGREHVHIGKDYLEHLKHIIRPLNEDLFHLIGKRFRWDNFIKKS